VLLKVLGFKMVVAFVWMRLKRGLIRIAKGFWAWG
jgi:hypothetical protein